MASTQRMLSGSNSIQIFILKFQDILSKGVANIVCFNNIKQSRSRTVSLHQVDSRTRNYLHKKATEFPAEHLCTVSYCCLFCKRTPEKHVFHRYYGRPDLICNTIHIKDSTFCPKRLPCAALNHLFLQMEQKLMPLILEITLQSPASVCYDSFTPQNGKDGTYYQ